MAPSLQTAALGLEIPATLLALAEEVVDWAHAPVKWDQRWRHVRCTFVRQHQRNAL